MFETKQGKKSVHKERWSGSGYRSPGKAISTKEWPSMGCGSLDMVGEMPIQEDIQCKRAAQYKMLEL